MPDHASAAGLRDHALLLVAHGSARYPDAGRVVMAHAEALRAEGLFAEVAVGLLNGEPAAADALAGLTAPVVHVVPFFMEDGWFTRVAVPKALGSFQGRLVYAAPVGTHSGMADLIEARVRRTAGDVRSLLVVGHGSARAPGRVTALHRHVERLAASGRFDRVEAAFLEEAPFAGDAMVGLRDGALAVMGFFAGEGMHVRDDLPALIEAERSVRSAPLVDCGTVAAEAGMRRIVVAVVGGIVMAGH